MRNEEAEEVDGEDYHFIDDEYYFREFKDNYKCVATSYNSDFGKLQRENSDPKKREYCQKNNIPLIEIPYTDYDKLDWEYLKEKCNL